jgi:hypothetical protein
MTQVLVLKLAFRTKETKRVSQVIRTLLEVLPHQVVGDAISSAIRDLALESPEAFSWAMQMLISPETLSQLGEVATGACTKELVEHGFKAGRDFASHPEGGLITTPEATATLVKELPTSIKETILR